MKPQSKVFFLITLAFLFSVFQTPLSTATLNDTESNQTVISNPLVCLVGVSEYDTQEELASVREEMRELYDLFHFDCGYEVRASFTYDALYASNHKNLPKMQLSLGDFNKFLEKSYEELYQNTDYYDGLIFVFSGHGLINKNTKMCLISTSDSRLQKSNNNTSLFSLFSSKNQDTYNLVGCKYFDDIIAQLTKLKKNDPKEEFATMPKIFFNLSCQSDPTQNLTKEIKNKFVFPKPVFPYEEEEEKCSILEQKRYERIKMKADRKVLTISSTLPDFSTGTKAGLALAKCLRTKFKDSLGQQDADKSLEGIVKYVRKSVKNCCVPSPSGGLMADEIFFASNSNKRLRFIQLIEHPTQHYQALNKKRPGGSSFDIQFFTSQSDKSLWIGKCSYYAVIRSIHLLPPWVQGCKNYFEYRERIGLALYKFFDIPTPDFVLSEQRLAPSIIADKPLGNDLNYQKPGLHILSKFLHNYQAVGENFIQSYKAAAKKKQSFSLNINGKKSILHGFGEFLAVADFIYDMDCLGFSGQNLGHSFTGDRTQVIKIDAGLAFSFLDNHQDEEFRHTPLERTIIYAPRRNVKIAFTELTPMDQQAFCHMVERIGKVPRAAFEKLIYQVVRPGGWNKQQADELINGLLSRRTSLLEAFSLGIRKFDIIYPPLTWVYSS